MEDRVTGNERLKEDIAYVRAATERSGKFPLRPSTCCGRQSCSVVSRWSTSSTTIAGSAGTGWSRVRPASVSRRGSGWRANRRAGQLDRQAVRRWSLHWLAVMAAGALGNGLVATGQLTPSGLGSLWVLLMALANFHAGVHLDRRMLPIGLILGAAYLATLWVTEFGWTAAGVATAAAFTVQAYLGARSREPAS